MFIDSQGTVYQGDMAAGDRLATPAEIAAWELALFINRKSPTGEHIKAVL